jgi:hypothetical protein
VPRTRRMADRRSIDADADRMHTIASPGASRPLSPTLDVEEEYSCSTPFSGAIVPSTAAVLALADHDRLDVALQQDLVKPRPL